MSLPTTSQQGGRASEVSTETMPGCRIGVVSYLNTLPLIDGLDRLEGVAFERAVPSALLGRLLAREVDLSLLSVVDGQRSPEPLRIVPVGMLGCRGRTMTVRLYSRVPVARVRRVHADTDSHTSVLLLQVLLRMRHGAQVETIPFNAREGTSAGRMVESPEAMLLIGDKVVTAAPDHRAYPHQLDLGEAWFESTGRPFVFATWMCRADLDEAALARVRSAAAVLDRQRRHNALRIAEIVHREAIPRGWPKLDAEIYLGELLRYEFGDAELEAMAHFFRLAHEAGLLPAPRALERLPI
jgi:chorismate dehydratase